MAGAIGGIFSSARGPGNGRMWIAAVWHTILAFARSSGDGLTAMRCPNCELDNSPERHSCANCACELALPVQVPASSTIAKRASDDGDRNSVHQAGAEIELSVVIPSLNEADTLADCIERAQRAISANHVAGEVVIADNGSTDGFAGSRRTLGRTRNQCCRPRLRECLDGRHRRGARQVHHHGGADGSYDFEQIPRFREKLREGPTAAGSPAQDRTGEALVPIAAPRRLLRAARFHESAL